jgi:hypothetical protein
MKRFLVGLIAAAVAAIGFGGVGASAASPNWKVGYYNTSGQALSMATTGAGGGIAAFNFTNQPNTALLVTTQGASKGDLLGNLSGKTISATFSVSGVSGDFIYGGEPSCGGTTGYVRLFFQTDNGGGFAYTHYWWSNPVYLNLVNGEGQKFSAALTDASLWSDWNGQFGTSEPDGFADAVANVTTIGLSFGGGCFFENGVGTTDGSGTFTLNEFDVAQ